MPLSLTQDEHTASGITYADVAGAMYEFPRSYRRLLRPGERFVYYRGRRTREGPIRPQVYLGAGIVGEVFQSPDPDRLLCGILDYAAFTEPVPFKSDGRYLEQGAQTLGSRAGLHFRRGVRPLTEAEYSEILQTAAAWTPAAGAGTGVPDHAYQALVRGVALDIAVATARTAFADAKIRRMPVGNPAFSILVSGPGSTRYVAVKSLDTAESRFVMSEGERLFSEAHPNSYCLWIFHSVDVERRTAAVEKRDGPFSSLGLSSSPSAWRCQIL